MKKILSLVLLVAAGVAQAESNPLSSREYKWHDSPLTNGQVAVVKKDYFITDALQQGHNPLDRNEARMFVEKIMLNGRKAVRLFEVHGWPVCPTDGTTCMVLVQKVKYRAGSNNFERGQLYRGVAKSDKFGNGYITNDDMVELVWNDAAFSINTVTFAKYNSGSGAIFTERGGEIATALNSNSDAGFDKMESTQWTGVVQNSTDGFWSNMKRSQAVREERTRQYVTSPPRVVSLQ